MSVLELDRSGPRAMDTDAALAAGLGDFFAIERQSMKYKRRMETTRSNSLGFRGLLAALTVILLCGASGLGAGEPVALKITGDWQVEITAARPAGGERIAATIAVPPPSFVNVKAEKCARLPVFNPKGNDWRGDFVLYGLRAQECSATGLLDAASVQVYGVKDDSRLYERGTDYDVNPKSGALGRLAHGRIRPNDTVAVNYRHYLLRLDSIVLGVDGRISLRPGVPHVVAPLPPTLQQGERRLANVWIPGPIERLAPEHLFPILEEAYPEPPKSSPLPAERLLPKTMMKLRTGQTLRILAWGDSVTVGSYLPDPERQRWQAQFVARLQAAFPKAKIELITEAWGARNTAIYLAEPPGSIHNYQEKVLGPRPNLIVSEFVNDAGLGPAQVEERYGRLLADFRRIGAEWIFFTPHYVRLDMMTLRREQQIDDDPRPYVAGLRQFAAKHHVAIADASLRWGRLWRQGIPYRTLLLNGVNHPDQRGMEIFADSLMALFL